MLVRLIMWQWWIVFLVFWVVLIILIIILFLLSFFLIVLPIITLVFFYFRTFSLLFTIPNLSALVLFEVYDNLSFPGSFNLVSEILALINIVWNNSFFCFSFLVAGLFSCYYWFLILNRKLPYHCCSSSLNWIEWFLFFWLLVLIYFLGFLLILSNSMKSDRSYFYNLLFWFTPSISLFSLK